MTENVPALIAEARAISDSPFPAETNKTARLIGRLADALESLSSPSGDTERAELGGIIHRTVPDDESLAHLCEDDDCLWYDIADAILAAGFRRPSPVTREALAQIIQDALDDGLGAKGWSREPGGKERRAADAILSRFNLTQPEPAEVEWAVRWTGTEGEPVTDLGADESDVRALAREQEGFAVAVKRAVGPWVPVGKGEEQ